MEKTERVVSIIIPYYNCASSLKRLLDSITIEINNDIQVIVVNDNSTEYLEEYKKIVIEYPMVLFKDNDSGVKGAGACRNVGLSYATGKWVLFSDADDIFIAGWKELIGEYSDSQYDVVYFSPIGFDENTNKETNIRSLFYQKLVSAYKKNEKYSETRIRSLFQVPWSKLIRRDLITDNHVCFDEVMHSNDVMFSAKIGVLANSIYADSRSFYCVVERTGSLTKDMSERVYLNRYEISCRFHQYLRENLQDEYDVIEPGYLLDLLTPFKRQYSFKCFREICMLNKKYLRRIFPSKRYIEAYLIRNKKSL